VRRARAIYNSRRSLIRSLMPIQDSRSEYAQRMHRVLEHIDRHLDQPLELDTLAAVAHFSSFHFHRLFSAWMGETFGEYLRRRRLEVAALRLVSQPAVPVFHVALSVGFGSAEAFARAFKARFGCTATSWRSDARRRPAATPQSVRVDRRTPTSRPRPADRNPKQAESAGIGKPDAVRTRGSKAPMKVKLIDRQATAVAYLRYVGPFDQAIAEFWQKTVCPWLETNDLLEHPRFGITHDHPSITAPDKCRYDACVKVPPGFVGTGKHLHTIIPGGKYAVAPFKGTVADIGEAWDVLLREWLPASGMQLDSRPFFEYYPPESTYDSRTGVLDCDLCIPVSL
jgi:AraC family transcriptional regulator